jgi:hypothetical protein
MHELFIHGGDSHNYICRSDALDFTDIEGDSADCFTTMNPNNYESILERLAQNRTVAVCSDRCMWQNINDVVTPEVVADRIHKYSSVPRLYGGFRRINHMDLIHAEVFRAYKAYEIEAPDADELIERATDVAETHPLADKLEFTGLHVHHAVLYMSFLFDPRRFVNPANLKDKSYYYNYTLAREGVDMATLAQLKEDEEFQPENLSEVVWASLLWCWVPDEEDFPSFGGDNPLKPSPEHYWFARYWEHTKNVMGDPAEIDLYARVQVTREVGDYILELWFDALGVEPRFNPDNFFKYPAVSQDYKLAFEKL